MKKVLSLVLVIAMILSSMSFAFAGTLSDVAGSDYEDAINTMVAFGVIQGYEDGTFREDRTVTRAEMAKILVEALGYGKLTAGATSGFADTQNHWADKWIAIAVGTDLVVGYPDGTFKPDATVTYDEALTMVVRALGYTDATLKGAWPTNFKVKALDLGLTDDVVMATAGADRGGVVQILYNALDVNLVQVDADNKVSFVEYGVDEDKKVIYKTLVDQLGSKDKFDITANSIDADSDDYLGDIVDLTSYMYQNITAYTNKDGDIVYVSKVNSDTAEGTVTANTAAKVTVEDADDDKTTYDVTSKAAIMLNGEEVTFAKFVEPAGDDELKNAEVTVVLNKDEEVTGIVARLVTDTVQLDEEYVEDEVELIADVLDVELPVNDDDEVDFDKLTVTGDADSLEDLEVNDVLALYYGKGAMSDDVKLEIVVTRETVEGKIIRVKSGDVTIDGKVYEPSVDFMGSLSVGDEVVLYLNQDGDIYGSEKLDSKLNEDYALVISVSNGYETTGTNGVRLAEPKVKLLTADGEKITYVLDDAKLGGEIIGTDLVVNVAEGSLVTYNVNKDSEINEMAVVGVSIPSTGLKTTGNSFNLASNAALFSKTSDLADAKVVDAANLDDVIKGTIVYDGAKIVAIAITEGYGKTESTYAVFVNNSTKVLDEDDDTVIEYTAFVEGEEVTYLGESSTAVSGSAVNGNLVKLSLSGGKIDGTATEVVNVPNKIKVLSAKFADDAVKADDVRVTTYITLTDDTRAYLSDDVVVYVYDISDGEVELGSKSDIRDNDFVAYNLSLEDTDDYEIVVVFVK